MSDRIGAPYPAPTTPRNPAGSLLARALSTSTPPAGRRPRFADVIFGPAPAQSAAAQQAHQAASHLRIRPSGLTTHGETILGRLTAQLGV